MSIQSNRIVGLFGLIAKAIKFSFTIHGAVIIMVLMLIIASIGAINKSVQEKNLEPLYKEVGGRLLNFENKLYISASEVEEHKGILLEKDTIQAKMTYLLKLSAVFLDFFSSIWFLYVVILVFYKIGLFFGNNQPLVAAILVIVVFISFEMVGSLLILDEELILSKDISVIKRHLPLRGIIKTITIIPYFLTPIYERISIIRGDFNDTATMG